jgi:hypothetical protein
LRRINPQVQACTGFNKDDLGFRSTQTVDLGGDDDGDVVVDDEDGTSPHDKGVLVMMTVLNSPLPSSGEEEDYRLCPCLGKLRKN